MTGTEHVGLPEHAMSIYGSTLAEQPRAWAYCSGTHLLVVMRPYSACVIITTSSGDTHVGVKVSPSQYCDPAAAAAAQ